MIEASGNYRLTRPGALARKRVLLITRNLPPLVGGMERLVHRMAMTLDENYALTVIGPQGCAAFLPRTVQSHEVPLRSLGKFLLSTATTVGRFDGEFDLVIAGSGLTAPLAWWAARRSRAPWAVYLHGLDIVAPSWIYQQVWLRFIRRASTVLANSKNTRRLAVEHGVPAQSIGILSPGTEVPGPNPEAGRLFRQMYGMEERRVMLSVGRLTPRKGLVEFIERAMPLILAKYPDAILLVIGADATNAARVSAGSQRDRISEVARKHGFESNIVLLPPCDDEALSAAYNTADVHVFPVLDLPGDVEGFGMVAIEAAAHGLPTVGFRAGGVPDAVIEGRTGRLIDAGDYDEFAEAVVGLLTRDGQQARQISCTDAAALFSWKFFSAKLIAKVETTFRGAA